MDAARHRPRYTRPQVLKVTGLRADVLQTWVNRNAIELEEQNPGTGRRRLYSEHDVVKLAVMRRLSDLSIHLDIAKAIAEAVIQTLRTEEGVDLDEYLFLTAETKLRDLGTIEVSGRSPLARLGGRRCNPREEPLASAVYWRRDGERIKEMLRGEAPWSTENTRRPLTAAEQDQYARRGFHAEPVVLFPIGEIVNGTLAQLDVLDEANAAEGGD